MPRTDRVQEVRGSRLALARFAASDFQAVHAFASDPLVCEHTTWGQGYGTEVATLLLRLGFEHLGLERVAATCAPDNVGSARVLEKAGLRREGLLRGHVLVPGRRRDSLVFGRLSTDA